MTVLGLPPLMKRLYKPPKLVRRRWSAFRHFFGQGYVGCLEEDRFWVPIDWVDAAKERWTSLGLKFVFRHLFRG